MSLRSSNRELYNASSLCLISLLISNATIKTNLFLLLPLSTLAFFALSLSLSLSLSNGSLWYHHRHCRLLWPSPSPPLSPRHADYRRCWVTIAFVRCGHAYAGFSVVCIPTVWVLVLGAQGLSLVIWLRAHEVNETSIDAQLSFSISFRPFFSLLSCELQHGI